MLQFLDPPGPLKTLTPSQGFSPGREMCSFSLIFTKNQLFSENGENGVKLVKMRILAKKRTFPPQAAILALAQAFY